MGMRITEKGVADYIERLFEIEATTDNELVEVLCIIAQCMLHDLNKVNIKLLATEADFFGRDIARERAKEKKDSTSAL